jgi:hypothetical protein
VSDVDFGLNTRNRTKPMTSSKNSIINKANIASIY